MKFFKKFIRNEKAATAIEYGLIAALIAVAGIAAFKQVGGSVSGTFSNVATEMEAGKAAPAPAP